MITLNSTAKLLKILLAGAVTTNELPFTASYVDIDQSTFAITAMPASDGVTTGATAVTMVAAPGASTTRQIKGFQVRNADTVAATVIIRYDQGGTPRDMKFLIASGDTLIYEDGAGYLIYDSTGTLRGDARNLVGVIVSVGDVTSFGTFTSAEIRAGASDETGTGALVFATSPTLVTPALGTPSALVLTNATGLPVGSLTGLSSGVGAWLATASSANLAAAMTDETGSGALVFATSPTLVTPALGTPASGVLTNCTGTASGLTAGNVTTNANLTGAVTSTGNATSLGSFTSAQLAAALTDETGSGANVHAVSPALTGTVTLEGVTEGGVSIGNSGTAQTLTLAAGNIQKVTMTGNCTFTMPTATFGKGFTLLVATGAGGFTATFTGVKWQQGTAPTLTTTASRTDMFSFVTDGTSWFGTVCPNFS